MKAKPSILAVAIVALTAAAAGCRDGPGLTESQVEQFLNVQQTIAKEQANLGRGRDDLEADRRLWAERERKDPIIASAIESAALLLACCLPVGVIAGLLFWHRPQQPDFDVAEALLLDLCDENARPRISPNPGTAGRLEHQHRY